MEFDKNIKNTKKFYDSLKEKHNLTPFEEKYITLYETEDITEFKKALSESIYKNAKDFEITLLEDCIDIFFYYNKIAISIEFNNEIASLYLTDEENDIIDTEITKEYKIDYKESNYEIFKYVLLKLPDVIKEISDSNFKEKQKRNLFSLETISKYGNKEMKLNLLYGILFIIFSISMILIGFIYLKEKPKNEVLFIILVLIAVISLGYEGIYRITRYRFFKKYLTNIKLDDEKIKFKGKADEVNFQYKKERYIKSLDNIVFKFKDKEYLASLPNGFLFKKDKIMKLYNLLRKTELEFSYYKQSNIIDLAESNIYELIKKIDYEE